MFASTTTRLLQPIFDPIAAVVYYGSGRDVAFTMIEGEYVYHDGEYPTIDMDEVMGFVLKRDRSPRRAGARPGLTASAWRCTTSGWNATPGWQIFRR